MKKTLFSAIALLGSFAAVAQTSPAARQKWTPVEHQTEVEVQKHGGDDKRATPVAASGQTARTVARPVPLSGAAKGATGAAARSNSSVATTERPERAEANERPKQAERPERPERAERPEHAGGHEAAHRDGH